MSDSRRRSNARSIFKAGAEAWNKRKEAGSVTEEDLENADLSGMDLRHANFADFKVTRVNFEGAKLSGATFSNAEVRNGNFTNAEMRNCRFQKARVSDSRFEGAFLQGAHFDDAFVEKCEFGISMFSGANLRGTFSKCSFLNAKMEGTNLNNANVLDCNFAAARLGTNEIRSANFLRTDFTGSDLRACHFVYCNLLESDLTEARFSQETRFTATDVTRCRISRQTLGSLKDYGGLSESDRRCMLIRDDVALLRSSFSGYQLWVHSLALVAFLGPYVWFAVSIYVGARFTSPDEESNTITVLEATARYIWNGGVDWKEGYSLNAWPLCLFTTLLLYNAARGVLLWKTARLELYEQIHGIPADFDLGRGGWRFLFQVAQVGLYLSVGVALLHALHFLGQRIVIG